VLQDVDCVDMLSQILLIPDFTTKYADVVTRVSDPHPFHADPDPGFEIFADLDPDSGFEIFPDLDPDSGFEIFADRDLDPGLYFFQKYVGFLRKKSDQIFGFGSK